MKAYWLDTMEPIAVADLRDQGIDSRPIDPAAYQDTINEIKETNGYVEQDVVEIRPDMENLGALLAKFDKEHLHTLDEVRFVLDGAGVFDIRSTGDRWMRIEVCRGDYISVPANRHHRFFCTDSKHIKCVRLFQDASGWTPIYRETPKTAPA